MVLVHQSLARDRYMGSLTASAFEVTMQTDAASENWQWSYIFLYEFLGHILHQPDPTLRF
jgi:hypothetical protein